MPTSFFMCMNCGCNEESTEIYKCTECYKTYCGVCSNTGFFQPEKCPVCDVSGDSLGQINKPLYKM